MKALVAVAIGAILLAGLAFETQAQVLATASTNGAVLAQKAITAGKLTLASVKNEAKSEKSVTLTLAPITVSTNAVPSMFTTPPEVVLLVPVKGEELRAFNLGRFEVIFLPQPKLGGREQERFGPREIARFATLKF